MRKLIYSLLILVFTFLTFSISEVSAKTLTNEKGDVTIAQTEVINDDLFIGAQSATVDGVVNGDVFIGAQTAIINGTINGNLHIGANTVVLSGNVKGSVYIISGNITINKSTVGGSVITGAADINIDKDSIIGGSIIAGARSITLSSQIKRNAYLGAATATIGGNAKIGKDLYYAVENNGQQINIASGAAILGEIHKSVYTNQTQTLKSQIDSDFRDFSLSIKILSFISALIIGFLYYKLFNSNFLGSANKVSKSFWKSLGVGFLITVAALPVFAVLIFSIIGIQLAWVLSLILMIGLYLTKIIVSFAVGNWVFSKLNWNKLSFFWIFAAGLVMIYALKLIPVVNFCVSLVIIWVGLGGLALHTFSKADKK